MRKEYLKSSALGLLLLLARMPDLSADGTPTNEMPAQLSALIEEANKIPLGRDGRGGVQGSFLRETLSAMGSEGIELLILELKNPVRVPLHHGGEMQASTFAGRACEIYAGFGKDAYDRLSEELKKDSSLDFWRNACYVYYCSEHEDSLDVLAGWVTENGVDARFKPQVSARAYNLLGVKLRVAHLPDPPFGTREPDLPVKFQQWWQSNRQTVVQQYLEQKKSQAAAAKVPDK